MKVLAIALANMKRLFRDRLGLFFIFVLPIVLIVVLGAAFGGGVTPKLGVVGGAGGRLAEELRSGLDDVRDVEVVDYSDRPSLLDAVEHGVAEGGLFIPGDYDERLLEGDDVELAFVARPGSFLAFSLRTAAQTEIDEQSARIRAARFATEEVGGGFERNLERAEAVTAGVPDVRVGTDFAQEDAAEVGNSQFAFPAAQELLLFMFVTSLSAAAQLIQTRQLGVSRRMISTPTSVKTVILGEALGRFGVAILQGLFILVFSALLFGIDWGDPLATGLVVILFALVGAGAAMLVGATFRNDEQANSVGLLLGLGLAALGGCMVPLEVFPRTMETVAHITPHAWAVEGMTDIVLDRAGVSDVSLQLGVLLVYAVVLLTIATWSLRRRIVG
ncbi:MAG: ABC transporter permease [Actinomycetota bacterium]|nr:ABC transporter permease [Actinomycetota bacterium]